MHPLPPARVYTWMPGRRIHLRPEQANLMPADDNAAPAGAFSSREPWGLYTYIQTSTLRVENVARPARNEPSELVALDPNGSFLVDVPHLFSSTLFLSLPFLREKERMRVEFDGTLWMDLWILICQGIFINCSKNCCFQIDSRISLVEKKWRRRVFSNLYSFKSFTYMILRYTCIFRTISEHSIQIRYVPSSNDNDV